MSEDKKIFVTSDIGIAAYLQLQGYKLMKCNRDPSGKFNFVFLDPNSECPARSLEFLDSDFCHIMRFSSDRCLDAWKIPEAIFVPPISKQR